MTDRPAHDPASAAAGTPAPGARPGPRTDARPGTAPAWSSTRTGSTPAADAGPATAEAGLGEGPVERRRALPEVVLEAIADGGAVVVPEGDSGAVTVRMSGMPLLRLDPQARPAAAWCSEAFGRSLVGLFQVERWTRALAANQRADLLLHQGLRAELEIKPILLGLGRGGFRATTGGGIRVTEYRLSHPALGDVATLHVGRNALHVSEVTWPSPKLKAMLRVLISIEAAGRTG